MTLVNIAYRLCSRHFGRWACSARLAPGLVTLLVLGGLNLASASELYIYDNTQNTTFSFYPNGGAATQGANTVTKMVADDITPLAGYGGLAISNIYYSVVNNNGGSVTARVRVGFWYANGSGGAPGTFIAGFDLGPLSLPQSRSFHSFNPGSAMTVPTNTFWFGMAFDDNSGTTGITAAQLNSLGMSIAGPPVTGSSQDHFFVASSAGASFANNPAGSIFTFGGSPVANFYFGLTVQGGNHAPVCAPQSLSLVENHTLPITLAATDADGDPLTYAIVNSPTNGTLSGSPPNVVYTPHNNFFGADAFTFKANDGKVDSTPALVSITVNQNHQPVANSQSLTVLKNAGVSLTLTATDADSDPLTYAIVNSPTNGTLSGTAPNLIYTPNAGYVGADAFTFKVNDGQLDSVPALVSLTVLNSAGLIIHPSFDSSITGDPNAATITNTINAAILALETKISNPVTVSILFTTMGSGLGQSSTYINTISYSSYYNALSAHAATTNDTIALAHLSGGSANPVNGGSSITLSLPNLRALGFSGNPPGGQDSTIYLNLSICNLDRLSINPSKYDLMAVATHEMDEVLGTSSGLPGSTIQPVDLFRYSSTPNTRNYTTSGDNAYFSLDGVTDLVRYNQSASGDYGDFWSTSSHTPRVQDAFATAGATPNLGVEYTILDAIGWTYVDALPTPTPQFTSITRSNNAVVLNWSAVSGRTYQLLSATNLLGAVWSNLGGPLIASNSVATYTDAIGSTKAKFYRVSTPGNSGSFAPAQSFTETVLPPPTLVTNYFRPAP